MARQHVAQATMLDMLIQETSRELAGKSAHFLAPQIEFRRREGIPNWDANCDIAAPPVVAAFGRALIRLQRDYDLD